MVDGIIEGCVGVYVTAGGLYLLCYVGRAALGCSLKEHVLEYVSYAGFFRFFIGTSYAYPHLYGYDRSAVVFFDDDRKAVFENSLFYVAILVRGQHSMA